MLGIGIDAVDVDRFRKLLERRPHLRQRLFTSAELTSLEGRTDDAASSVRPSREVNSAAVNKR